MLFFSIFMIEVVEAAYIMVQDLSGFKIMVLRCLLSFSAVNVVTFLSELYSFYDIVDLNQVRCYTGSS